ncbi:5-oxoprolinase subunit PxpB [Megamonas hypermegale]|uniref:5-oxoprolinase subunit PxpB n=1 Tax=Megamonas hypermegale TaxID=158847 RepID=UPI0026EAF173|nr:5-oxoprolinase subunit PxpB [Megamonas hypermegale]
MNKDYEIKPLGETSVIVKFGNAISPAIHNKIQRLADYLEKYPFTGMVEYVMSYTSLVVYYNPFTVKKAAENKDKSVLQLVTDYLDGCMEKTQAADEKKANVVEIPVCYGGKYGPDIEFVAEYNHLSVDEVIQIHTAPEYLVYMIGFCPGFPYLGGMDERIATPRRDMPRLEIPARSIGIAGQQTGGYPISTPGGWQIIGRTALEMFNPHDDENPSLLHSGDLVKFYAVSEAEYLSIREAQK